MGVKFPTGPLPVRGEALVGSGGAPCVLAAALLLAPPLRPHACSRSELSSAAARASGNPPPAKIDRSCDLAEYPSDTWAQCEADNYAMVSQAPAEPASNPDFMQRW